MIDKTITGDAGSNELRPGVSGDAAQCCHPSTKELWGPAWPMLESGTYHWDAEKRILRRAVVTCDSNFTIELVEPKDDQQ